MWLMPAAFKPRTAFAPRASVRNWQSRMTWRAVCGAPVVSVASFASVSWPPTSRPLVSPPHTLPATLALLAYMCIFHVEYACAYSPRMHAHVHVDSRPWACARAGEHDPLDCLPFLPLWGFRFVDACLPLSTWGIRYADHTSTYGVAADGDEPSTDPSSAASVGRAPAKAAASSASGLPTPSRASSSWRWPPPRREVTATLLLHPTGQERVGGSRGLRLAFLSPQVPQTSNLSASVQRVQASYLSASI